MRFISRFRREPAALAASEGRTETLVEEGPPPVVEEEVVGPPPPPPRQPLLWPWLLLLLLLVAGGLIALWLLTRGGGDHKSSASVVVPNVVGEKQGAAVSRLDGARLTSRVVAKPSTAASGTVFAEEPLPGSHVTRGSVVTLSVSSATVAQVPDVVGDKAAVAARALRRHGLAVDTASVRSRRPTGIVLSQSPAAGASVAKGSTVVIRVSRGAVRVPNLVGQSRSTAVAALRGAGLVPTAFTVPSAQPKGQVVAQHPRAGVSVPRGSKVRINLSNGSGSGGGVPPPPPPPPPPPAPATRTIPDVTGQLQEAAQQQLNTVGFKSRVVFVSSDQPEGTVVSPSPTGGNTARKGTRIRLNTSLGPTPGAGSAVPRVIGLSPKTATARLRSAGFEVQRLTQTTASQSQDGLVVDEQPIGTNVPAGTTVTIYVGSFSS